MLPKLTERLQSFCPVASKIPVPTFIGQLPQEDGHVISHLWFWPRLGSFFKSKDIIVTETGIFFPSIFPWYSNRLFS
jgi:pyruvate decarboxylase